MKQRKTNDDPGNSRNKTLSKYTPERVDIKEIIKNIEEQKKKFAEKLVEINPYDCLIVLHSLIEASHYI